MQNIVDTSIGSVGFWLLGYGFAYGSSESMKNPFIGIGDFMLLGSSDSIYAFWFFSWAFCATAATIASGAMAERTQFTSYLVYTFAVSSFIYPVAVHWVWSSDGWLRRLGTNGFIDSAGGSVVHVLGGCVGLVGSIFAGPRLGRFPQNGEKGQEMPGHSTVLAALGAGILWYGWYGFNAGSSLGLSRNRDAGAALASVVTTLTGTFSTLTTLAWQRFETRRYDVPMVLNGLLGGLVASTAPCLVVPPWASAPLGIAAAGILIGISKLLVRLKIDDPLDAVAVHVGGGLVGLVGVGLFAREEYLIHYLQRPVSESPQYGLFLGGGWEQLGLQLLGTVVVILWTVAMAVPLFGVLRFFKLLRVGPDGEAVGLDITKHGGSAYPNFHLLETCE